MSKALDFLKAHESPIPSRWREEAQWRRDNAYWLKYSRFITLQVLQAMDKQSVTQVQLAERMGCTQQYVSNLLKGSSNMTLETIAKLEQALNIDIISSALTYHNDGTVPYSIKERVHYASEPDKPEYGTTVK